MFFINVFSLKGRVLVPERFLELSRTTVRMMASTFNIIAQMFTASDHFIIRVCAERTANACILKCFISCASRTQVVVSYK